MAQIRYTHADLEALWLLEGGTAATADVAAAIAQAESVGCLYAKAGPTDDRPVKTCTYRKTTKENSYGLWQINRQAHPSYSAKSLYTALGNAGAAVAISRNGSDFGPWTTYTSGAYKQYLTTPVTDTTGQGATASAPPGAIAPAGHKGYSDLRNSLGRHLPTQLERSKHTGARTLSLLAHKGRVSR